VRLHAPSVPHVILPDTRNPETSGGSGAADRERQGGGGGVWGGFPMHKTGIEARHCKRETGTPHSTLKRDAQILTRELSASI
jgi:hypothetical protein